VKKVEGPPGLRPRDDDWQHAGGKPYRAHLLFGDNLAVVVSTAGSVEMSRPSLESIDASGASSRRNRDRNCLDIRSSTKGASPIWGVAATGNYSANSSPPASRTHRLVNGTATVSTNHHRRKPRSNTTIPQRIATFGPPDAGGVVTSRHGMVTGAAMLSSTPAKPSTSSSTRTARNPPLQFRRNGTERPFY
jgi:hypothetical protein